MNDDDGESDIPTTIIRSKADYQNTEVATMLCLEYNIKNQKFCIIISDMAGVMTLYHIIFQTQSDLSTNDIVMNKLTQILAHLRQGLRNKKLKKKERTVKEHVSVTQPGKPKVTAPEANFRS